ncbi:hypothetical protein SCMC78_50190 [Streptomyces sp. CMC78]|uniref:Sec-independent protein translocase protein TatA n=1 Tax=Streptomyces sp. CMC78 TaxID=3231512 RepID=A0AB33KHD5_9ACTN
MCVPPSWALWRTAFRALMKGAATAGRQGRKGSALIGEFSEGGPKMFDLIELSVILSPGVTLKVHLPVGFLLYAIFSRGSRK